MPNARAATNSRAILTAINSLYEFDRRPCAAGKPSPRPMSALGEIGRYLPWLVGAENWTDAFWTDATGLPATVAAVAR